MTRFNGYIGALQQDRVCSKSLCSQDKFSLFSQFYELVMGMDVHIVPCGDGTLSVLPQYLGNREVVPAQWAIKLQSNMLLAASFTLYWYFELIFLWHVAACGIQKDEIFYHSLVEQGQGPIASVA